MILKCYENNNIMSLIEITNLNINEMIDSDKFKIYIHEKYKEFENFYCLSDCAKENKIYYKKKKQYIELLHNEYQTCYKLTFLDFYISKIDENKYVVINTGVCKSIRFFNDYNFLIDWMDCLFASEHGCSCHYCVIENMKKYSEQYGICLTVETFKEALSVINVN